MVSSDSSSGGGDVKGFVRRVVGGRWFTVFASILIMSMSGTGYMFGMFSTDIKTSLGYDQTTLNWLSFFKDMGGNLGILSGLINEVAPPWVVIAMGAIMNFTGYFMVWLSVTGRISKPKVWEMCLFMFLSSNAHAFSNTGALVTCVKNFPESRGPVIGLLKGFVGLSGAIMAQLYHALYGDNSKALILLLAWFPATVLFIFLPIIRIMKIVRQANELKIFYNLFYISLGLAGFLMVLIIIQKRFNFNRIEYIGSAFLVVVFLLLPIFIVAKEEYPLWMSKKALPITEIIPPPVELAATSTPEEKEKQIELATTSPPEVKEKQTSCAENIFNPPPRGEDYTILQALFSLDMLILFVASTCGLGGTLTAMDNMGQIGNSLGYPTHSTTTFISLISIWSYLGRTLAGFSSEYLLTKYKIPRPLLFTIILLLACVGHLLIAFGVPNSLYFSSVIIGFCFGAQWPLMFAIISEIFGLKYYSTLANVSTTASPVGSYILNVRVTGYLYDKVALTQMEGLGLRRQVGQQLTCSGVQCYKMAFLIITATTIFGCLISFILVLRTRKFYQGDIYKKFRTVENS